MNPIGIVSISTYTSRKRPPIRIETLFEMATTMFNDLCSFQLNFLYSLTLTKYPNIKDAMIPLGPDSLEY